MKKPRIALLLLLPAFAFAASLDSLAASARNLKGEYAAEALLRLAAAPQTETAARIALLELAFERAAEAQEPYKRRAMPLRVPGASAAANKRYQQDMDALSLRLRAVEAMLPLDPARARQLFGRVPAIALPRLKCTDYLLYDVSRFYEVLDSLVHRGFTAEELKGPEPAKLLERYAGISAPAQAGPMAHAIAASGVGDQAFTTVLTAFAKALGKIEADDRAFTSARLLGKEIETLVVECKRRGVSPQNLLENYRTYLVIHLSSARCADNDLLLGSATSIFSQTPSPAEFESADFVAFFNRKLRQDPLKPIEELEATPLRLEGVATGLRSCQGPACRTFAEEYRKLFQLPDGQPAAPAARETPEWTQRFQAVVASVTAWKPENGEPPAEHFREKTAAYGELLGLAPAGANRDLVLHALLAFLENNPLRNTSRLEWFLPVNALAGRTALDPAGYAKIAEEMWKSSDPVIALFANLEQTLPRPADRILPLL